MHGAVEAAGLRLAILTTLVRLLEVKAAELEGPDSGTGPLEEDVRLLEAGAAAGAGLGPTPVHAAGSREATCTGCGNMFQPACMTSGMS